MSITPEILRLILTHAATAYLRPVYQPLTQAGEVQRRLFDNARSGDMTTLVLEYSPWPSGGSITLSIGPRSYREPGMQVEVNWPGCGTRNASDTASFFKVGGLIADLAGQVERHLALEVLS